ncbi:hypothetical protein ACTPD5_21310, partial [Clostridioides difficile]
VRNKTEGLIIKAISHSSNIDVVSILKALETQTRRICLEAIKNPTRSRSLQEKYVCFTRQTRL